MNASVQMPATTFSMIVAHIISEKCRQLNVSMSTLYEKTGISQPSWSRLSRGQTKFDLEDLNNIEVVLGIPMSDVLADAKQLEKRVRHEGIKIIPPYTTQKRTDLADAGLIIVAGAVLGFLAMQALKK